MAASVLVQLKCLQSATSSGRRGFSLPTTTGTKNSDRDLPQRLRMSHAGSPAAQTRSSLLSTTSRWRRLSWPIGWCKTPSRTRPLIQQSPVDGWLVVLQSCHTYSAVKNAWKAAARRLQRCGVELLVTTVQLPFPVTSEQAVIGAYEVALAKLTAEYGLCTSFLAASSDGRNSSGVAAPPAGASADTAAGTDADASTGGNAGAGGAGCAPCSSYLRLACLDHISSLPAMVLPVAKLVGLCRDAGFKRVFVDGAHAPGTVSKFAHTRISGYGV